MPTHTQEFNFDGIVGPTHNYAGLSYGNLASQAHQGQPSSPREAALQGLAKADRLMELGLPQAVLPPQRRPNIAWLRKLGFTGSTEAIVREAGSHDPALLAIAYSASAMWTANAATVSPSPDTADHRLHVTPANLISQPHRAIEADETFRTLGAIFADTRHFCVHPPLPRADAFADEGAANHTRLCASLDDSGVELFVYGRSALHANQPRPARYPARQTRQAVDAVARRHLLDASRTVFAQQHPDVIDAGVFHNDVICIGNENVLLLHERAFLNQAQVLDELREKFRSATGSSLQIIEVDEKSVSVPDAVASYLFNSQLVTLPQGDMALIHPSDCTRIESTRRFIDRLVREDNPIMHAHEVNLRQSMNNGGGPACLRLRITLTEPQRNAMHQGIILTHDLHRQLTDWVKRRYRDRLTPADLHDPTLAAECHAAMDELDDLLDLPHPPATPD